MNFEDSGQDPKLPRVRRKREGRAEVMTSRVGPGSEQNSRTVTIPKGGREIGKVQAGLGAEQGHYACGHHSVQTLGICCFTLALREQCLLLAAWESRTVALGQAA